MTDPSAIPPARSLDSAASLVEQFRADPAIAARLGKLVDAGNGHLGGIAASAQAFVAAALAAAVPARRLWLVCRDLRQQERVQAELETWGLRPHFLPEEEVLPMADAISDPEIAAERLHVLSTLGSAADLQPVVLSARSLDEQVPAKSSFRRATLQVGEGLDLAIGDLVEKLAHAGYDAVPQIHGRGQYAIRGGILDVFPWQAGQPLRLEYFGDMIDSLREFDLHSQTSTRRVPKADILLDRQGKSSRSEPLRTWLGDKDLAVALGQDDNGHAPDGKVGDTSLFYLGLNHRF